MALEPKPPRLLYLADVPVEVSYHGSALLYRLLEHYPKESLVIAEAGTAVSKTERRIEGVEYLDLRLPFERLSRSRFWRIYNNVALRTAKARAFSLLPRIKKCAPDALITVSHGSSWITGAQIAAWLRLPLHLICHDEWARAGEMQDWKNRIFANIYRQASSRLCVSPYMADEYKRRYGVTGAVLYPSRAKDALRHDAPPQRLAQLDVPFTCVFAGTINSDSVVELLRRLSSALDTVGGRLVLYGPITREAARASNLDMPNISLGGMLTSARLMEVMRDEADALFVPMSFTDDHRPNMRISFPSKLTDYTAVGVPLIVCGPEDCSAVRWAREHPGVAEVISDETETAMINAITRLARDPAHRLALAATSLRVGEAVFSYASAFRVFSQALMI